MIKIEEISAVATIVIIAIIVIIVIIATTAIIEIIVESPITVIEETSIAAIIGKCSIE